MTEHEHEFRGYDGGGMVCSPCNTFFDASYFKERQTELADARAEVERLRADLHSAEEMQAIYLKELNGWVSAFSQDKPVVRELLKGGVLGAHVGYVIADALERVVGEHDRLGATAALLREALAGLYSMCHRDTNWGNPALWPRPLVKASQALSAADPDEWLRAHDEALVEPYRALVERYERNAEDVHARIKAVAEKLGAPQDGAR